MNSGYAFFRGACKRSPNPFLCTIELIKIFRWEMRSRTPRRKDGLLVPFPNRGENALSSPNIRIAILELGAWTGTIYSGVLAERISRKYTILVNVVIFCIGVIVQCTAVVGDASYILGGRFVTGMGVGRYVHFETLLFLSNVCEQLLTLNLVSLCVYPCITPK